MRFTGLKLVIRLAISTTSSNILKNTGDNVHHNPRSSVLDFPIPHTGLTQRLWPTVWCAVKRSRFKVRLKGFVQQTLFNFVGRYLAHHLNRFCRTMALEITVTKQSVLRECC